MEKAFFRKRKPEKECPIRKNPGIPGFFLISDSFLPAQMLEYHFPEGPVWKFELPAPQTVLLAVLNQIIEIQKVEHESVGLEPASSEIHYSPLVLVFLCW